MKTNITSEISFFVLGENIARVLIEPSSIEFFIFTDYLLIIGKQNLLLRKFI